MDLKLNAGVSGSFFDFRRLGVLGAKVLLSAARASITEHVDPLSQWGVKERKWCLSVVLYDPPRPEFPRQFAAWGCGGERRNRSRTLPTTPGPSLLNVSHLAHRGHWVALAWRSGHSSPETRTSRTGLRSLPPCERGLPCLYQGC